MPIDLRAMAAVAGAIVFGLMNTPQSRAQSPAAASTPAPAFEVVSIKPSHDGDNRMMIRMAPGGRFEAHNIPVKLLLEQAYDIKDSQISGAPGWLDSDRYNIDAKAEDSTADNQSKPDREAQQARLRAMLQGMLADRFKLTLHHDTKEMPIYALVVAKNGPKFHETTAPPFDPAASGPPPGPGGPMQRGQIRMMGRGDLTLTGVPLTQFADVLSRQLGRLVVDKTGLKGEYDFTLKWSPDEGQGQMFGGPGGSPDGRPAAPPPDANGPSVFTALQEQLGLKLESEKGPVDTIVIDHVEKPSEN
jgi:bla regulator protein BlaR1